MPTFEFEDTQLGPTKGWKVTIQAADAGEAAKKLATLNGEKWREPQWRPVFWRSWPVLGVFVKI